MMNQEDIFKKIGQILNELQDQYDFLAQNPQQLNELELELFLANANFLTDHVQIVRKLNNNKPVKELAAHIEPTAPVPAIADQPIIIPPAPPVSQAEPVLISEPVVEEPVYEEIPEVKETPSLQQEYIEVEERQQEDLFKLDNTSSPFEFILDESEDTDKFEFEERSVEDIFDRPLSKEEADIIAQKQRLMEQESNPVEVAPTQPVLPEQPITDEVGPEPFLVIPQEEIIKEEPVTAPVTYRETPQPVQVQSLFSKTEEIKPEEKDNVTAPRPTLNEILAGKGSGFANLNEERTKVEITDLKGAINLNEKLLYIKDLFNGYNLAYSEAIDLINKMPDLKTADTFLKNNYSAKNNWENKQATVDKFYELLKQRFPQD